HACHAGDRQGLLPNVDGLEMNLNSGGFLAPPLRRGCRAESNKAALPQEFGATGEVKHLFRCRTCLTSPRCAVSKVAFHFLERRRVPSSKEGPKSTAIQIHLQASTLRLMQRSPSEEGIKIHHYSGRGSLQ